MYEDLIERLRRIYENCGWDDLKIASNAIETIGMCWNDSKRYASKLEHENLQLRTELDHLKNCRHECKIDYLLKEYNKVREERDQLKRERDQAAEDLSGDCGVCKHKDSCRNYPNYCINGNTWEWRGVQEEKNETD